MGRKELGAWFLAKLSGVWSRAQPKPETEILGKETEAEAQLYRFWQHKKIKEMMLRVRELRTEIQAVIPHECNPWQVSTALTLFPYV